MQNMKIVCLILLIRLLKTDWPYVKQRVAISEFQPNDFLNLFQPKGFIDSLAMFRIENKVTCKN